MLLAIPTSTVLACGNSSEKEKIETTSCSKQDNHFEKKSCCEKGEKEDNGRGRTCNNKSCHFPSSVNIPVFYNDFKLNYTNNFTLLDKDWAYVQHTPKTVYLPIWQPPKIS